MDPVTSALAKFFGAVTRPQTYLNILYLLLAFPLGIFYFVFLITGLAAGFPLIIVWIGLLVLALVFAAWYAFIAFERQTAIWMLHEDIPPMSRQDLTGKSLWQKFTATLANPVTWKGLVYLFAKFPLGILSFVVVVTLLSVSVSLLAMPFYYPYVHSDINLTLNGAYYFNPILLVNTLPKALIVSLIGVFVTLISLHAFNGLAWLSGKFARIMLGNFAPAPLTPPAVPPTIEGTPAPTESPAA